MSKRYLASTKVRHPALSDRDELIKAMERYGWVPKIAANALGVSSDTILRRLKELAPDVVDQKRAEGKLLGRDARSL